MRSAPSSPPTPIGYTASSPGASSIPPGELIEDACANAWTILVGRPDITLDARGFAWLVAVATNEALRLVSKTRPEHLAGGFLASRSGDACGQGMLEPVADHTRATSARSSGSSRATARRSSSRQWATATATSWSYLERRLSPTRGDATWS
jgi:hypothetical protein